MRAIDRKHLSQSVASDSGFSVLEVVFALGILMVVALGLIPLGVIATTNTENQGHLMARTTEYGQDKMEQLLTLPFGNIQADTRVFPAAASGGTGLTVGGSDDPSAPVAKYVDYLDIDGNLLASTGTTAPANWFYQRVWKIAAVGASTTMKQISVTTTVKIAVGSAGRLPIATITAIKTDPF